MELKQSSWHYQLYLFLAGHNAELPKNMCPYFWKYILPGIFLFLPLAIIMLPGKIMFYLEKKNDKYISSKTGAYQLGLGISLFLWLTLTLLSSMIIIFFNESNFIIGFGVIGWILTFLGLIIWLIEIYKKNIRKRRKKRNKENEYIKPYKEPTPNIFIEGIKAWYNKNCPKITWKP